MVEKKRKKQSELRGMRVLLIVYGWRGERQDRTFLDTLQAKGDNGWEIEKKSEVTRKSSFSIPCRQDLPEGEES